jgi:hypothetical protein
MPTEPTPDERADDFDQRETRPYDTVSDDDNRNEGEGSRTAARRYNAHATDFARDKDRVERAATAAKRSEDRNDAREAFSRRPRIPEAEIDGGIEVKFDGTTWCVCHASLDKPLTFSNLEDAERRAGQLGRESRLHVVVYAQDGAVLAAYDVTDD